MFEIVNPFFVYSSVGRLAEVQKPGKKNEAPSATNWQDINSYWMVYVHVAISSLFTTFYSSGI